VEGQDVRALEAVTAGAKPFAIGQRWRRHGYPDKLGESLPSVVVAVRGGRVTIAVSVCQRWGRRGRIGLSGSCDYDSAADTEGAGDFKNVSDITPPIGPLDIARDMVVEGLVGCVLKSEAVTVGVGPSVEGAKAPATRAGQS